MIKQYSLEVFLDYILSHICTDKVIKLICVLNYILMLT